MRDDSLLNTGGTSVSSPRSREVKKSREERREEKHEKRLQLKPAGEIVYAEIQKDINTLIYSPYADEDKMSDVQFRTERRARRLAIASLLSLQTRLANILREPSKPEASDE